MGGTKNCLYEGEGAGGGVVRSRGARAFREEGATVAGDEEEEEVEATTTAEEEEEEEEEAADAAGTLRVEARFV